MQTTNKMNDKDQLMNEYVNHIIDGMDLKDCAYAVLHDLND